MSAGPTQDTERAFVRLIVNSLASQTVGAFIWWVFIFWAFIETQSVIITGVVGAAYMAIAAAVSPAYGAFVDRRGARTAMNRSTVASAILLAAAWGVFTLFDAEVLLDIGHPVFWIFLAVLLGGSCAAALRGLAVATLVSVMVRENRRDRMNGVIGTVNGVSFVVTSVFSGLALGYLNVSWSFAITTVVTMLAALHLASMRFDDGAAERERIAADPDAEAAKGVDIAGALAAIRAVPGLGFLIALSAFNNLLGGIFMALLDAYGLTLTSAQTWGFMWGVISLGMILGGIYVARRGLGEWPVRALILANLGSWLACCVFAVRSSLWLLGIGTFVWLLLSPIAEAAEQTILQRAIPHHQQGRVFGFAQLVETAAAPVTSLAIAPFADRVIIPTMTDGRGADWIGSWFGTGPDRGMALLFTLSGIAGVLATIAVRLSPTYRRFTTPPRPVDEPSL